MAKADDFVVLTVLRYADACLPPGDFQPDCPFAQSSGSQHTCASECRAVATNLLRRNSFSLSGTQKRDGSAFDAKQCLLSEKTNEPGAAWHVSSLMLVARRSLSSSPYNIDGTRSILRHIDATGSLSYLAHRGFEVEGLVRYGLSVGIKLAIASRLSIEFANRSRTLAENSRVGEFSSQLLDGWLAEFQTHVVDVAGDPSSVGSLLAAALGDESSGHRRFGSLLDSWLMHAPLTDIIEWRRGDVEIDYAPENNVQVEKENIWLVDRYTETYMNMWSQTSVVMEYQYLQGNSRPYLPTDQLRLRSINHETVNAELARRAVEHGPSAGYMDTMQRQAVEYLEDGRRDAAAGIFEAARILEPHNGQAHNNYGFCLLPDHPLDALKALRQAEKLQGPNIVNSINQAVGNWLLGEYDDALQVANDAYARGRGDEDKAYLWDYFDAERELGVTVFDVMDYLCRFGLKLAKQTQDSEAIKIWMARVSDLPPEFAA